MYDFHYYTLKTKSAQADGQDLMGVESYEVIQAQKN